MSKNLKGKRFPGILRLFFIFCFEMSTVWSNIHFEWSLRCIRMIMARKLMNETNSEKV